MTEDNIIIKTTLSDGSDLTATILDGYALFSSKNNPQLAEARDKHSKKEKINGKYHKANNSGSRVCPE